MVGSIICYAALWDRSATLRYGRVTDLKVRAGRQYGLPHEREAQATLRVCAVDRRRTYDAKTKALGSEWAIINGGSPITLGYLDRLLIVPDSLVPVEALKLLLPQ